ncbi:MAG: hypothetical protein COU27_02090 [Candidatus Levybacteria bacterium CG10_big_fil_rev_8_21_14_0_10_36_7]|nr:MAG: hypothetical protein COU27_02090 [Candidatus Levybacteria bacterium CG10_big_fil_rev_8_21_14_0_10_36_7]
MSWNTLAGYLERFKSLKPPKQFMQDTVVDALKETLGFSLNPNDIDLRGGILYLKIKNPAIQSEIFMRKQTALQKLSEKMGKRAPKDIRF